MQEGWQTMSRDGYGLLRSDGKMLRFIIDDYIRLRPDRREGFQFVGRCPKTKKPRGIIVNEYTDSIYFPFLRQKFIGLDQIDDCVDFLARYCQRNYHRDTKLTERQAKELNKRLRRLSFYVVNNARAFWKMHSRKRKRLHGQRDGHLEYRIEFLLAEGHRLYHPLADNILCAYVADLPKKRDEILLSPLDFNDTTRFKSFEHCYLFHDLTEHKHNSVDELYNASSIWVDYKIVLQESLTWDLQAHGPYA